MHKTIHNFALIALILMLGACNTLQSPWHQASAIEPAQSPPSSLKKADLTIRNTANANYEAYLNKQLQQDGYTTTIQSPYAAQTQQLQEDILKPRPYTSKAHQLQTQPTYPQSATSQNKVALLLPLSGEHAQIGQAMLNAAQMALFDIRNENFILLPKDTKSTRQGASLAATQAIDEGATLILGPLFAEGVKAVKPIARKYNIMNISFSTDWTVAGANTMIMGILPFAQVQRVTDYATLSGLEEFGLVAPRNQYGNIVSRTFKRRLYELGTTLSKELYFSPLESNISPQIRSFTEYDKRKVAYDELMIELDLALEQLPEDEDLLAQQDELQTKMTFGEPPFQAVMIPVGGEDAKTIVNLIQYYDIEGVQLIGTGLWDDPGIAAEPAFNGAIFAAPSPIARRDFERKYQNIYSTRPPRIASLAYDATALASVLAHRAPYGTYPFSREALLNPNGFTGIDGIFRFRTDGLIERGLAVLEIKRGQIRVLDPAPKTFEKPLAY